MRIYLACTVRGDRSGVDAARLAAERLAGMGHDVLTGHLLRDDVEQSETALGDAGVFERDVRWLESCDALLAEASGSTYGVGFEVGYVLGRAPHTGQRVYVMYDALRAGSISRLVSGNTGASCRTLAYRTLSDVRDFVEREFGSRILNPES